MFKMGDFRVSATIYKAFHWSLTHKALKKHEIRLQSTQPSRKYIALN